jgi:FkbH-like protein
LCIRKVPPEQRHGIDLTSWRVAFNGAEQVRRETIERFAAAFGPCGFQASTMCPAYGLAEATLKVSAGRNGQPPIVRTFDGASLERGRAVETEPSQPGARALVACGRPSGGTGVLIVDSHTSHRCSEDEIGEIWVSGPGVAHGYWSRPDETSRTFRAALPGVPGRHYLRTGDLGFLDDGELFVVGRLKELIIIRGHNYYPQDIELTVGRCHQAVRPDAAAAFAVDTGAEERLAIVCEIERTYRNPDVEAIAGVIRAAIAAEHNLQVYAVGFLRAGGLPRTSSGKLQRHACLAALSNGGPDVIGISTLNQSDTGATGSLELRETLAAEDRQARQAHLENWLRQHVADALCVPIAAVDLSQSLITLGLDSLMAVELRDRLEREFGVILPVIDLLRGLTTREVAAKVFDLREAVTLITPAGLDSREPDSARRDGIDRPLSPEQERLWLLDTLGPGSPVHNIPTAIQLDGAPDVDVLERCFTEIIRRHEPLRTTFHGVGGRSVQRVLPPAPCHLPVVDLQEVEAERRQLAASELASREARRGFDLGRDRLIRVVLFRLGPSSHLLVIVVHHIVFDWTSLNVLLRELRALYEAFATARPSPLPELGVTYADLVERQRQQARDGAFEPHLRYWNERLRPARRALALPTDWPRGRPGSNEASYAAFTLPADVTASIRAFCRGEQATPFVGLLSAFVMLLARWTGERVITVGCPTHARKSSPAAGLIGLFAHPLAICADISAAATLRQLVRHVRERVFEAYAHEDVPFAEVVKSVNPERQTGRMPLFPAMFSLIGDPAAVLTSERLAARTVDIQTGTCEFDLWLTVFSEPSGGLRGVLAFNRGLFRTETAATLIDSYVQMLRALVDSPDLELAHGTIAIASTFTAESLRTTLSFWMDHWSSPLGIEFAPFDQVFQQLLDARSLLGRNTNGVNVVAIRVDDLLGVTEANAEGPAALPAGREELPGIAADFIDAVAGAARSSPAPYLVCLCPGSPRHSPAAAAAIASIEHRLASALRGMTGVYVVTKDDVDALYPVANYYDAYGDRLTRTPFTDLFYAALSTLIARRIYALRAAPYKVVVLDCDHTLWSGECAIADGGEIELDAPRRFLQEFMVQQHAAGMLLCLCSKNNDHDVFAAFDKHPEMPLRPEHLVSWRINWQAKSANIEELARELGVDPASVVFIDDSPFECAEVRVNCPGVLTLQLPDADEIPSFLRHLWIFDRLNTTEADASRSQRYKQNQQRARVREEAGSLEAFLNNLQLRVTITAAEPAQWPRIAQLTQRTNQFNTTTIRRSESEIQHACARLECLTVSVVDRFGDYGLVGVVLFQAVQQVLVLETFLLSCRTLGRRVEHQMLAAVTGIARSRRLDRVDIHFMPTARNQPARDFLDEVAGGSARSDGDRWIYTVPSRVVHADVAGAASV